MKPLKILACFVLAATVAPAQQASKAAVPTAENVLLRAMKDELERSRGLKLETLDQPYYIEYSVDDHESYSVSATLGALFAPVNIRLRLPRVRVRVGSPEFDNTNYVFSDYYSGSRYDAEQMTLDDDYGVMRRHFWLASDRTYKGAIEAIARKRAALRNVTQQEALPDFWKAESIVKILPGGNALPPLAEWPERVRRLSQIFEGFPEVNGSGVTFDTSRTVYYFRNSEATALRIPDSLSRVSVRAGGQAADGMNVRDSLTLVQLANKALPDEQAIAAGVRDVANNVKALAVAPVAENYTGPVLFEGMAAAQVFAEVLGPNLAVARRPVSEPSRSAPFLPSELEGRIGSRILPEFLDVVDNPLEKEWDGAPLVGSYEVDEEGVIPKPVTLVQKGRLQGYLLTRQPAKGFEGSNGRARMPGAYGSSQAMISNLFVRASESVKPEELKAKLVQMIKDRSKPFGLMVRKMDYPTTAPNDELRRIIVAAGQRGGARPTSPPILVYRVYPDGREELVRGLRFRGLNTRSLRDIVAVSDRYYAFHFMNTPAPLAISAGGYIAPASVIAPGFLIDDLELERPQEELPKLPVVPPPPLTSRTDNGVKVASALR